MQDGVGDGGGHAGAKSDIGQELGELGQGGDAMLGAQGQACGAHHVVGARSPKGAVDPAEHRHEVVHNQVGVAAIEGVEAGWAGAAVGVDEHQAVCCRAGQPGQHVGHQIAFGVDQHDPPAGVGVGQDHLGQQSGFPRAGRAERMQVMPGIAHAQRNRPLVAAVGDTEGLGCRSGCGDPGRWGQGLGPSARHAGDGLVGGQVS